MTKYFPDICWGTRLYEAGFLPTLAQHLAAESIINSYTSTISVREEQLMGHSQVAGKALGIHSPFCLQWMEPCGERSLKHRLLPASSESPCFCAYGGQLPPEWTTLIDCRAVVSHWTRTTVQPSINHYCQAACTLCPSGHKNNRPLDTNQFVFKVFLPRGRRWQSLKSGLTGNTKETKINK